MATALGEAGVGIVRISGSTAVAAAERVFRPKIGPPLGRRQSHRMVYGWVVTQEGLPIDEALGVVMKGPRSYTGEDVVELHCHGGQVAVRRVLDAVLAAGTRLAEPGEFTKRAFLNGRMDLAQAEAVIDIIRAKTDRSMSAAVQQLRGDLSRAVEQIRDRLLEIMAHLEADIDFPELELEVKTLEEVDVGCNWCLDRLQELLVGARQGKILRDGFRVVLAGRPNVGKSSLLNRLVRDNRAIVTAVPGTTRDVIEEWVNIAGLPVVVADTAGIRETEDVVERLGVDRSRAMLERADLVLIVLDAATGVTSGDLEVIRELPRDVPKIALVNKLDLLPKVDLQTFGREIGGLPVLGLSAETGDGLQELERSIAEAAGSSDREENFLANARQEQALRTAVEQVNEALDTLRAGYGSDLVSIDIRGAWMALGEITGESVSEELLDQIFSRFCIGK